MVEALRELWESAKASAQYGKACTNANASVTQFAVAYPVDAQGTMCSLPAYACTLCSCDLMRGHWSHALHERKFAAAMNKELLVQSQACPQFAKNSETLPAGLKHCWQAGAENGSLWWATSLRLLQDVGNSVLRCGQL